MQYLIKSLRRAPAGGIHHDATGKQFRGGQFIPAELWTGEKRKAADAFPSLVASFADKTQVLRRLYEQNVKLASVPGTADALVPLEDIEGLLESSVRETYARAFLLGKRAAGNLFSATAEEQREVEKMVKDELKYLRNFLEDIREGEGKLSYPSRMSYYANALTEPYTLGFSMGNRRTDRYVVWDVGETEHCSDCLFAHNGGKPWRGDVFWDRVASKGILPHSGNLECKVIHCGCSVREATKEEIASITES